VDALAFPHPQPPEGFLGQLDAFMDYDALDRLAGIAAPTLVLAGELDIAAPPRLGRVVAEQVANAEFETLPGQAAHRPFAEAPDDFNARVDAFWRGRRLAPTLTSQLWRARLGSPDPGRCHPRARSMASAIDGGCCTNGGVVRGFKLRRFRDGAELIACDREQELLLPPSLREWLAEEHLAWFVLDAVEQMDLAASYVAYRADGHGRAAHDPASQHRHSSRDRSSHELPAAIDPGQFDR
jgi:hypothetical protein